MKRLLSLVLALCTLFCLFPVVASANEVEESAQNVLIFDYLSYRTSGADGIRSVFSVNKDAVAALTDAGYTVVYGAIMAIGTVKKPYIKGKQSASTTVYNEAASDITVALGEDGKAMIASGTNAGIVSSDNGLKYLDNTESSFAFTTVYNVTFTKMYEDGLQNTTIFYRGFTILTDQEGNSTVYYDDPSFGSDALNTPSLYSVCDYVLKNSENLPKELKQRLQTVTYLPWSPPII